MPAHATVKRLTPVLLVDTVEPCVSFWTSRLGFEKTAEVPGPDGGPQFAMLVKDGVEVMYQTWRSVEEETPEAVRGTRGHSVALFIEVSDIEAVDRATADLPRVAPRHRTFYGMDEFSLREPGGSIVTFAMPVAG